MFELVFANLQTRPFRTLISIIGVALGVVLVTLFTGLADGIANDMAKRAANWKAEIVFTRPGAMGLTGSNANLRVEYADRLNQIDGIESTVPVIRYITTNQNERWGVQQLDGVDWKPFSAMNEMKLTQGRAPEGDNEIVVDERQMSDKSYSLGDSLDILGKEMEIVGVFSPPSGARIKMSLSAMQNALQAPNKCTYILVKLKDGADIDAVAAAINKDLPGNKISFTRDLVIDAQDRVPGLKVFLRVLVGLGAFVSTIFVLLCMYTTITERRKEIGILKSLGASKSFVVKVIEGEAFLIGILGVVIGMIVSFLSAFAIEQIWGLPFEFSSGWIITAISIAIIGSLVGALYPAWRASDIDPVLVLTNE